MATTNDIATFQYLADFECSYKSYFGYLYSTVFEFFTKTMEFFKKIGIFLLSGRSACLKCDGRKV